MNHTIILAVVRQWHSDPFGSGARGRWNARIHYLCLCAASICRYYLEHNLKQLVVTCYYSVNVCASLTLLQYLSCSLVVWFQFLKMPKRSCKFNCELGKEYPYIKKIKSDSDVHCLTCYINFSVSHNGKSDITQHLKSEKHKLALSAASSSNTVS